MKKLLSMLSVLSLSSTAILSSTSSIKTTSKINQIKNNTYQKYNNKNNNNDISNGMFWYAPNIKVNSLDNNPLVNSGLSLQEQQYCDFVFLKSLYGDADNDKDKTTISINYSFSKLVAYDTQHDIKDIEQDEKDFQVMQNYKDAYGHIGFTEGQSLVNQYLNNGLLSFNPNGYIPSRTTYFQNDNYNNDTPKQTVIIGNYDQNNLTAFLY